MCFCEEPGMLPAVTALLRGKADVGQVDMWGSTALHTATEHSSLASVELLLARNAQIDLPSKTGRTALHAAAVAGDLRVLRALVDGGGDADREDHDGRTPVDLAKGAEAVEILESATAEYKEQVVLQEEEARRLEEQTSPRNIRIRMEKELMESPTHRSQQGRRAGADSGARQEAGESFFSKCIACFGSAQAGTGYGTLEEEGLEMADQRRQRATSKASLITPKSPQKGDSGTVGFVPGPAMVDEDGEDVGLTSPEGRARSHSGDSL